ncbi:16S rRNA (uracil(1498)-N(3))-methyltransferase [Helicobacter pullorum]|uniref:16S rRNA (uracil(1498)-N(3))-methyltransferase n=1 Tax=Helicobacter pullorum TaxID=35818 RepID=UPI00242BC28B|nr:16S rRNA (uracil(1498)-N(3))-methyltransferase [Helicobacter pullorum]
MQFIIHKDAGNESLILEGEAYHHLFHSRRTKKTESLQLRNLRDYYCYTYSIADLSKKYATLKLESKLETPPQNPPKGHLIWAMIDPKIIEKTLPFLNELNLQKITFFYAEYSQKNFKLNLERIQRILENSCEQCGRITLLEIEVLENLQEVLEKYPNAGVLDFGGEELKCSLEIPILVGTEGGFSKKEREALKNNPKYTATSCNILRSETAAIYAIARVL